jgi:hypothetical protein
MCHDLSLKACNGTGMIALSNLRLEVNIFLLKLQKTLNGILLEKPQRREKLKAKCYFI